MSSFYPEEPISTEDQVTLIRKIGKELRGIAGTNAFWMSTYCFTSRDVDVLRSCVRAILGKPEASPLDVQDKPVEIQTSLFSAQTA